MIKIGEMKVNSNIKPETYLMLIVFAIIMLVFILRYSILDYRKTKDYSKEKAIITDKYTEYYKTGSDEESKDDYIEFDYEYNHQTYHNKQRVVFLFNKKIGDEVTVYINPNNPNEIKDTYNTRALYISDVVLVIWIALMTKAYQIRKKSK